MNLHKTYQIDCKTPIQYQKEDLSVCLLPLLLFVQVNSMTILKHLRGKIIFLVFTANK